MHILTFDVEEWYYLYTYPYKYLTNRSREIPLSLERETRKIFRLLEDKNCKATFFWLGEEAERYPMLVRELKDHGHEIGVHSFSHLKIEQMGKNAFKMNLEKAVKTIEDIAGQKVTSYRAPFFSLTWKSLWALEILKDLGIECDSSTVEKRHIGSQNIPATPFIIKNNGIALKEFPATSFPVFRFDFKYASSGYFRVTPYNFLYHKMSTSPYLLSYFHPRDFDRAIHKKIRWNPYLRLKYRIGAGQAFMQLDKLSDVIPWVSLQEAQNLINWDEVKVIEI